jgi:hypothetical protein
MALTADERAGLDDWQLQMYFRLQHEYGHTRQTAWSLASMMRWDLEIWLGRPQPLCIVTGVV